MARKLSQGVGGDQHGAKRRVDFGPTIIKLTEPQLQLISNVLPWHFDASKHKFIQVCAPDQPTASHFTKTLTTLKQTAVSTSFLPPPLSAFPHRPLSDKDAQWSEGGQKVCFLSGRQTGDSVHACSLSCLLRVKSWPFIEPVMPHSSETKTHTLAKLWLLSTWVFHFPTVFLRFSGNENESEIAGLLLVQAFWWHKKKHIVGVLSMLQGERRVSDL